ncbi:hypothetical protein M426DRAFT_251705 [Hypoxylon sp. CI-4A]|nr:hypothetical protein M426DRAFT_251705 [Hypoxylon sp. CI-4A]
MSVRFIFARQPDLAKISLLSVDTPEGYHSEIRCNMEPISAIASFIAIGQALAATPKIIDTLQSLVHARREVLELLNQVERLNTFGIVIRESIDSLRNGDNSRTGPQVPPSALPLLVSVQNELGSIVSQLDEFTDKCHRKAKESDRTKIKRGNWFWYRKKITRLTKEAKKHSDDLQLVLSLISSFSSAANGRLLVDIHTVVVTQTHDAKDHASTSNEYDTAEDDGAAQLSLSEAVQYSPQPPTNATATQNHEPLIQFTGTLRRSCPSGCACQCHWPARRTQQHSAQSYIYGWLKSAYSIVPQLSASKCDVLTCRRAYSPVHVNLRIPLLFYSRSLEVGLSYSSMTGAGASLHLRVSRVLAENHGIWTDMRMGRTERVRWELARRGVYPLDIRPSSTSILEDAPNTRLFPRYSTNAHQFFEVQKLQNVQQWPPEKHQAGNF